MKLLKSFALNLLLLCFCVHTAQSQGLPQIEAQAGRVDNPAVPINLTLSGTSVLVKSKVKGQNAAGESALVTKRFAVSGTVAQRQATTTGTQVVLTNPDGKLKFFLPDQELSDANSRSSLTLTLPANGNAVAFKVSGETMSDGIDDAVVEARNVGGGGNVERARLTVFGFDNSQMNNRADLPYRLRVLLPAEVGNAPFAVTEFAPYRYENAPTPEDPNRIRFIRSSVILEAKTTLKPAGMESLPSSFTLSIVQEAKDGQFSRTLGPPMSLDANNNATDQVYRPYFIDWVAQNTRVGNVYSLPWRIEVSGGITGGLDGNGVRPPFYDTIGSSPVLLTGESVARTTDAPRILGFPGLPDDARRSVFVAGNHIADVYVPSVVRETRNQRFVNWCAVRANQDILLLAQGGWAIALDLPSSEPSKSKAMPAASGEVRDVYPSEANRASTVPAPNTVTVNITEWRNQTRLGGDSASAMP